LFCKFCGKRQEGSNTNCGHCKSPLPELQNFGNTGFTPATNLGSSNDFTDRNRERDREGNREEMDSLEDEQLASVIRAKTSNRKKRKDSNVLAIVFFAWMILMTIGVVYLFAESRGGGDGPGGMVSEIEELKMDIGVLGNRIDELQREVGSLVPEHVEEHEMPEGDVTPDVEETLDDYDSVKEAFRTMERFLTALRDGNRIGMIEAFEIPEGMGYAEDVVNNYQCWLGEHGQIDADWLRYITLENLYGYAPELFTEDPRREDNVQSVAFLFYAHGYEYIVMADFRKGIEGYYILEMGGTIERELEINNGDYGRARVSNLEVGDSRRRIHYLIINPPETPENIPQ